jgi:hypothetical protein
MIVKDIAGRRMLCWEPAEEELCKAFEKAAIKAIFSLRMAGLWDGRLRYNINEAGFVLPEADDAVPLGREQEDGLCLPDDGGPSTAPRYGQAAVTAWATKPGGDGRGFALPGESTAES